MNWIKRLFRRQPKVWAVYDYTRWTKVVSYVKPYVFVESNLRGPFRSEVDCEEFCDLTNKAKYGKCLLYRSQV